MRSYTGNFSACSCFHCLFSLILYLAYLVSLIQEQTAVVIITLFWHQYMWTPQKYTCYKKKHSTINISLEPDNNIPLSPHFCPLLDQWPLEQPQLLMEPADWTAERPPVTGTQLDPVTPHQLMSYALQQWLNKDTFIKGNRIKLWQSMTYKKDFIMVTKTTETMNFLILNICKTMV